MTTTLIHPVSITRFPLRRLSPGAGLLRYVLSLAAAKIFQGLGPKRRESSNGDRAYVYCINIPFTIRIVSINSVAIVVIHKY